MLPSQYMARWNEIEKLMSPMQNFKSYREEVKNVELPAIPYFGRLLFPFRFLSLISYHVTTPAPMLRDITFIYDGNREYLSPGIINFEIMGVFNI